MADVTMPQLGETVTEGTITKWMKKVGDTIAADEVLFEVSTDKVDSEVPSPAAGVLSEILVQEGDTVDVGTKLATIGDSANGNGSAPAAQPETPAEPEPVVAPAATPEAQEEAAAAPPPPPAPAPAPRPAAAPTATADGPGLGGRVLSPIVRKLISDNNLDANSIAGTGVGGRITREDVQSHMNGGGAVTSAAPTATAPRPAPMAPSTPSQGDQVVPFSNIRKRTAEHMIMSKATSAHTLVVMEVDYDNVDRVRNAKKATFKQEEGVSLTYLPFVTRAVVDALREFPYLNASVGVNELIVHRDINVGIAVDLNFEGLLVPVVKGADGLRLRQVSRSIADLASRARGKKLQADDISGGTFTITNAGGYGTFVTYPVINQPQVAILSTDGVKKRPVAIELPDGSDAIVVHPVGNLALAWDHRAVDGAYASAFMARVRELLETRDWLAEL